MAILVGLAGGDRVMRFIMKKGQLGNFDHDSGVGRLLLGKLENNRRFVSELKYALPSFKL